MQILTVNFFPQFMHTDLNKFVPTKASLLSEDGLWGTDFQSQFLAHFIDEWGAVRN